MGGLSLYAACQDNVELCKRKTARKFKGKRFCIYIMHIDPTRFSVIFFAYLHLLFLKVSKKMP
jgi:hypothetical protein